MNNQTDLDKDALLKNLMEQHGSRILRLCFLYLKDYHLAEDAVQNTFLKVYEHLDGFRHDSSENTSEAVPVFYEDEIKLQITKEEGSKFELIIPEKDCFTSENYKKLHGEPVFGEIIQSKPVSYVIVNAK